MRRSADAPPAAGFNRLQDRRRFRAGAVALVEPAATCTPHTFIIFSTDVAFFIGF
jgi:hypothetical protein